MKLLIKSFSVFLLLMAGVMATSANAKVKAKAKKQPIVKDVAGLAQELIELQGFTSFDAHYIQEVENIAIPHFNGKKSLTKKQKTLDVLAAATKYADETLASGSTADMMNCNYVHSVAHHYKTAINSELMKAKTKLPAVVALNREIEAWEQLENTLCDFYASYAYIENEGGSLSYIFITAFAASIAQTRYNDTDMLLKTSFVNSYKDLPQGNDIKEKANEAMKCLTTRTQELLNQDSDFKETTFYQDYVRDFTNYSEYIQANFDEWINARLLLLSYLDNQSMGLSGTYKILDFIKEIGASEQ